MSITITPPENYLSAFSDIIYTINGTDPEQVTDVEILNAKNNSILGIKRYKGDNKYCVNVAGYAQQIVKVDLPSTVLSTFYPSPNMLASIGIRVGDTSAASIQVSGASVKIEPQKPLSTAPQTRKIALDEQDMISFITLSTNLTATAQLYRNDNTSISISISQQLGAVGPYTLVVNMHNIGQKVEAKGCKMEEFCTMTLDISASSGTMFSVRYRIVDECSSRVRLCWLNSLGAIDCYSLKQIKKESVHVRKDRIYAESGYQTVGVEIESRYELISDYENRDTMTWLAEIASSPTVWTIDNGTYHAMDVMTNSVIIKDSALAQLAITLRPTKRPYTQKA